MRRGNRGWKTYLDAPVLKCFPAPEKMQERLLTVFVFVLRSVAGPHLSAIS